MSKFTDIFAEAQLAAFAVPEHAPTAGWDFGNALRNARSTLEEWGGYLLALLGVVALIWGGVLLVKKLMANPQTAGQQSGWGTIAMLIIVGGAFVAGGWNLISDIGSGGEKTIRDLGGGTLLPDLSVLMTNVVPALPL